MADRKDRQVSAVWEKVLSFGPEVDWMLSLGAFLAGGSRLGLHAWGADIEGTRSLFVRKRTRQATAFLLTKAHWGALELLRRAVQEVLKLLGYRSGEELFLIVDGTQNAKRAKKTDAVGRISLHAERRHAGGHTVVGTALSY